jgi:hypothetical protein
VFYSKNCDGWHEVFHLQAALHGNPFFYVNYGIAVPDLCPVSAPRDLRETGLLLWDRLQDVDNTGAFGSESKKAIEDSSGRVFLQYKNVALPWFAERSSWDSIASDYYATNPIDEAKLGQHSVVFGADFRAATYGYLLLKAGHKMDARRWLMEAERLMSLPVFYTRDGRTVHEKEKFARIKRPEPHELEWLREVKLTLETLGA